MSELIKSDAFIWNGITVYQENDVFKIGTDAILLGSWIPKIIKHSSLVLDVGTGTGILALMMGYFFPEARIHAIDIDEKVVRLAHANFQNSKWPQRLHASQENILELSFTEKNKYDLIICNPPYYFGQLPAKTDSNNRSKHTATPDVLWFEALSDRLSAKGNLCLVLPYEKAFEWIRSANESGLYCKNRLDIYTYRDGMKPIRSLVNLNSSLTKPDITKLHLHEHANRVSEEYMAFSGIQQHNTL